VTQYAAALSSRYVPQAKATHRLHSPGSLVVIFPPRNVSRDHTYFSRFVSFIGRPITADEKPSAADALTATPSDSLIARGRCATYADATLAKTADSLDARSRHAACDTAQRTLGREA